MVRLIAVTPIVAPISAPAPSVAADRYAAADHCVAPVRTVAPAQIVVTPDGVRVVAQKDGDRSVQADLPVEVARNVVTPSGVRCAARNAVTPSGVRCAARSEVIPSGVRSAAQSAAQSAVTPSVVIRNEVQSVALIGFHSLSHRPRALSHPHFVGCVWAGHHCAARGERLHPTATSQLSARSYSTARSCSTARYCSTDL